MDNNTYRFSFIDLFSGIGGFRLALNNIGGECLNFSEINKDAINTYCRNFQEQTDMNLGDITKISHLPSHDLLTAGVPCQSWSIAGRNLGFDDDRGQLWNDTLFLLNKAKPKAFIFENVKGLVDPRNQKALSFILKRIRDAGYTVDYHVLNSYDYGVPQNRVRIYLVGFRDECFFSRFKVPKPLDERVRLGDILLDHKLSKPQKNNLIQRDLFGGVTPARSLSLSQNNGFNDYFLFNDLRNGHSTVHSWDIMNTTSRQKHICNLLLKNRRKSAYGHLDGNPLSLNHFKDLDKTITEIELNELVDIGVLKPEEYSFQINTIDNTNINEDELLVLEAANLGHLNIDVLKSDRKLKLKKVSLLKTIETLKFKNIIFCDEVRYDFKNTKISTGLNGINRIFLPKSNIFPTLVASDSNDFVALEDIEADNAEEFKKLFIENIYQKGCYRKITKKEACLVQGFPEQFDLPESRARWMKLIGNSVSVPVIQMLGKAILETGVFD